MMIFRKVGKVGNALLWHIPCADFFQVVQMSTGLDH